MHLRISNKLLAPYVQRSHRLLTVQNNVNKCGVAHYTVNYHRKNENNPACTRFSKLSLLRGSSRSPVMPLYMNFQRRNISDKEMLINIPKDKLNLPPMESPNVLDPAISHAIVHEDPDALMQIPEVFVEISQTKPVLWLQDLIVMIHDEFGVSWWATMILAAVFIRTYLVLPLHLNQMRVKAKLQAMDNHMVVYKDKVIEELKVYKAHYGWPYEVYQEKYAEMMKKEEEKQYRQGRMHPNNINFVVTLQMATWGMASLAIRNLCHELPPSARATEIFREMSFDGFGWMTDLTIPDPYSVFPFLIVMINFCTMQAHKLFTVDLTSTKNNLYFITVIAANISMLFIAISAPVACNIYWLTSSLIGLIQIYLMHTPIMQRILRVPTLDKKDPYWFYYKLWKKNYQDK